MAYAHSEQSTTFSTLSRNGLFSGIDVISIDLSFSFSTGSFGYVDKVVPDRNCPNQWRKEEKK